MMLNEQDCVDRINAYTLKDWQPLFALIPRIESTSTFGEGRFGLCFRIRSDPENPEIH